MTDPIVAVRDMSVAFPTPQGSRTVLASVDLTVERGEFVSLIGPSGCGKTTLLRAIANLNSPSTGTILIEGRPAAEVRNEGRIGFAFQSAALLDWRTALDNVALPLQLKGASRKAAKERARDMLAHVGLEAYADHHPRQLSGGMQQRIAIARALVLEAPLVLMDEPFAALDEISRQAMNEWLMNLQAEQRSTVVFVTHNIREAVLLSDRVIVMSTQTKGISAELTIDLPRPRNQEVTTSDAFFRLWREGENLLSEASRRHEDAA